MLTRTFIINLMLLLIIQSVASFYLPEGYREKRAARIQRAQFYFKKYGYFDNLPICSTSTIIRKFLASCTMPDEIVVTEDDALKRFQREEKLELSGYVDDATIEIMEKPRCGDSDLQSLGGKKFLPWKNETITYAFINFSNQTDHAEIKSTISIAFGFWTPSIPRKFVEINDTEKADLKILFTRKDHNDKVLGSFDGPGGTLGHADISGQVHFDDDETWKIYTINDEAIYAEKDLLWSAVHEIGHALGLLHSNDPDSVMTRIYPNKKTSRNLYNVPTFVDSDIENVQEIYGEI